VLVRSRSFRFSSLHPSRLTLTIGLGAAIASPLSSAVLFVSYWPYSELLQGFLRRGDDSGMLELSAFLRDTQHPLGSRFSLGTWVVSSSMMVFYFWFAVTVLCAFALLVAVARHLQTRPRASAAA
jgi:hypothetical protein